MGYRQRQRNNISIVSTRHGVTISSNNIRSHNYNIASVGKSSSSNNIISRSIISN